jgi:acetyl-CoA C-acetyltransferase
MSIGGVIVFDPRPTRPTRFRLRIAADSHLGGSMSEAVIVDAIRTPVGRAVRGTLRDIRADDLAAVPLRALTERNPGVDFSETNDIMMGCGFPDHEQGYNVARNAQLLAGIDHHVPAVTVSRFCASSLQTIRMAFHAIKAGEGDQYIAAGVECVSRGAGMTLPVTNPRLDGTDGAVYNVYIPMGVTAENVAERCKVSRESQDAWALLSQQRAVAARESGHFDPEIVGVDIPETHDAGGDVIAAHTVTQDDGPRAGTTMEGLAKLKPVFKPGGSVTAGNSCPLNDGAAAVLVMSEEKARERGLEPRARIVASSAAAVRPEIMGLAPIPAVKAVLKTAGMKIDDIDAIEINEAFAAQVVPCSDELGIDPEKLNVSGGAIALGHPFGMTGARIMTTLLNNLDMLDGRFGLESMCVAGGMGQAMIVERLN